jgi:hypothetical protein
MKPLHKCPMPWPEGKLPSQVRFVEVIKWWHFHRCKNKWKNKTGINNNEKAGRK